MIQDPPEYHGDPPAVLGSVSRVASYRLEEQVGAGGMAVVYRARDERLGRLVALKIMAPAMAADAMFRQRFTRESRAAAKVDHPHIIPVYEAGEAGGVLFIAMRFVSGGDVGSLLRREGPLQSARAASIISPVASALDAAHAAGLVHRDIKPANVLLAPSWPTRSRLPLGLRAQQGSAVGPADRLGPVPWHARLHRTGADRGAARRWAGGSVRAGLCGFRVADQNGGLRP